MGSVEVKDEGHRQGKSVYVDGTLRGYVSQNWDKGVLRWYVYSLALRTTLTPTDSRKDAVEKIAGRH